MKDIQKIQKEYKKKTFEYIDPSPKDGAPDGNSRNLQKINECLRSLESIMKSEKPTNSMTEDETIRYYATMTAIRHYVQSFVFHPINEVKHGK